MYAQCAARVRYRLRVRLRLRLRLRARARLKVRFTLYAQCAAAPCSAMACIVAVLI